jgi:hypothetical protein
MLGRKTRARAARALVARGIDPPAAETMLSEAREHGLYSNGEMAIFFTPRRDRYRIQERRPFRSPWTPQGEGDPEPAHAGHPSALP